MTPLFTTGEGDRAGLGFTVMESFCDKITVKSKLTFGTTVTPVSYTHLDVYKRQELWL